jgi:hypothetical protein
MPVSIFDKEACQVCNPNAFVVVDDNFSSHVVIRDRPCKERFVVEFFTKGSARHLRSFEGTSHSCQLFRDTRPVRAKKSERLLILLLGTWWLFLKLFTAGYVAIGDYQFGVFYFKAF